MSAAQQRDNLMRIVLGVSGLLAALALAVAGAPAAMAQSTYGTAAGQNVKAPGMVPLQCDANGANCRPASRATIVTGQVAITTSSTLVAAARAARRQIVLTPTSSVVYYVGASGVTSSTGLYVAAGASITIDTTAAVYAVGASNVTISFVETF